jgi:hypothetical protein
MRFLAAVGVVVLGLVTPGFADDVSNFDRWFVDATLRVDYLQGGDASDEFITLDRVYRQGSWAGSRTHRIDPFEVGRTLVELRDPGSNELLFSRRLDSYFGEYRTTAEAVRKVKRAYHATVLAPFPKAKVKLLIKTRQADKTEKTLLETEIDPGASTVSLEPLSQSARVFRLEDNGDPHETVDVAIIAEGYTLADGAKLAADFQRFEDIFFSIEPFTSNRLKFNLRGVWQPSKDQGCDEPSRGIWKSTSVGASFDALGSERYLLTEDNKALRDIAAHAPYDVLYIMVNTDRYGGGGIYNLYCTFTADNQWSPYVFLHEFGHHFAALADEYYTSSVAYTDFFPKGVEPIEPNVTALLDPQNIKWKPLVTPGIALPTPWEKATYDEAEIAYQKLRETLNTKIGEASRLNAPTKEVDSLKAAAERLSLEHATKMDDMLLKSPFANKVGAFEGAGYTSKGLYRPSLDCIMFSKGTKPFCPVCRQAIERVIAYYGE